MLPDINGVDVLKFLDKNDKYQNVSVVINSELPEDDPLLLEAFKFNVAANLGKSKDREQIVKTFQEVINSVELMKKAI